MNTPARILIVEDDAVLTVNLQATLIQMGYAVVGMVATGAAAVKLALAQKPDAILMDIHLRGEMTGIQASEHIHRQLDVPIIYLSAYTDEALLQEAKITAAYAYLAKPVRDRELRASLEMAFYKHVSEQRLHSLNQVLRAVRDINQLITREHDAQHLLDQACKILLPTRGYRFVNIIRLEGNTVNLLAQAGDDHKLGEQMALSATPEQFASLPAVEAYRTGQVVICEDMLKAPRFTPWREDLEKGRFASMLSVPIRHDASQVGVLSVFADQPNRFDQEEVELLVELAGDIAFGLKSIAEEAARKQEEEARQQSETKFKAAFMTGLDAFYITTSEEGVIIEINNVFEEMFGYSREEVIGRTGLQLNLYADPTDREKIAADLYANNNLKNLELRGRKKDGQIIICSLSMSIMSTDGKLLLLGVLRDITEQKQAEEALRASDARLRNLLQNVSSVSVQGYGPDGTTKYWNLASEQLYGYSEQEAIGRNLLDLIIPPEMRTGVQQTVQQMVETGQPVPASELSLMRSDGSRVAVISSHAVVQVPGQAPELFCFDIDLTARKQAEEALRESQSTLNAIINSTSDMIWSVDPDSFGLMTFNQGLSNYFLQQRDIAITAGMRPEELFPTPEFIECWQAFYQQALREGPFSTEYTTCSGQTTLLLSFNILHRDEQVFGISVFGKDITERNRAQEELQILKYSIDTAPDSAYWMDIQGNLVYVNDAACKALRYSRAELLQMNVRVVNPLATPLRWAQVVADLREKKNFTTQSIHRRKDGSEFPVELNSAYIKFGDQEYINGFAKDITERKLAEEKIAQSEKKYRELFQVNKDGIAIFGMSVDRIPQPFIELNDAAHNMFGYSKEEMLRMTPMMLEPEVTPQEAGFRQFQLESKGMVNFETVLTHKNGQRVYAEFTAQVIQYEGRPAIMNIIRDITERKNAEDTLRESEEKYRALVENSIQGVILFQGPRAEYVNSRMCEISGYSAEELLPVPPLQSPDLIHPEDLARAVERSQRFNRGEPDSDKDAYRILRKNGEIRHVEVSAKALNLEGKSTAILTVVDVTERNQREQELQAIATLSAALRTAPTRAEMLPVIVDQIANLVHSDSVTVEIIDPQNGDAVVEAAFGSWKALVGNRQEKGTGLNSIIEQTLKPYRTQNLEQDLNVDKITYPDWAHENIVASAGMPLITQEKLIGFIWIGRKTAISDPELRLLSSIADITANAIQRATSHEQTLKAVADLAEAYDTTLEGWARALELRDQETEGHARRVVGMTVILAQALGIQKNELENVRRGALLHDIGKMGIPDSVLLKPGTLNEREWEIMRRHTEYARDLLMPIDYLSKVTDIPYDHHEKWDGSGYPRGLKGEEIPLSARLFAVADVWDALTSDRPYRKAWSREQALKYIREQSGRHFDPSVVELFLNVIERQ